MIIKVNSKKIALTIILSIAIIIIFKYIKPKYYVENTKAKNLPCKIRPYRDSIYVYIPYQLTIYNNRLSALKISSIYEGKSNGSNYGKYLLYNLENLELNDFWNPSKKLKTENNYQKNGDNAYWRIQPIIKYRNHIFPFMTRDFYYYKRHTLSNKNNRFNVKQINEDSIQKQLYTLDYNIATDISKSITDSLYKATNNKRFNVNFKSELLIRKSIRAKINNEEQEMIYLNFYDSIKGMNKEEKIKYLRKQMKLKPGDMF
ncbi:hypothetical protein [Bizionia paragorgiae]|uniref:Uncharacterized protein n=1 Tax=Bizionia paragorgiae TaxID=283786 RepID=A0A1H4DIK7_BIZPA|nr:hypothetical protein [Bizionia paragorgiae]SEA72663.1 hypothetical protein SAMN04487990_1362 [Bizionia paragorgiae]SEA72812.1 hypothetical protein SAMN04487990_1372 [Bizionia paragorgiae]